MIFPIFNMPCLHSHHQQPHILHSRDPDDGEISSSAAIGLAVGLALIVVAVAALVYCLCWPPNHHRKHRRQNPHRRENHADRVTAETEQTQQRQDGSTQTEQESPMPKAPLSIHRHQHDDKHFHGGHSHDHRHEGDYILDCHDHNDDRDTHSDPYQSSHGHQRHRHHRFHRTHQILLPRDPIAEFEKLIRPLSPGFTSATRADLEAILNGLDIPLPNEPAQMNGRADVNINEQGTARSEEESGVRRKKRHHRSHRHHHCHRRHKRMTVH